MIEKSDSKQLSLATAPILGQPPRKQLIIASRFLLSVLFFLFSVGTINAAKTGMIDTNAGVSVAVGNQPAGAGMRPFDGLFDDLRIYSTALSSQQISDVMDGGGLWLEPDPVEEPDPTEEPPIPPAPNEDWPSAENTGITDDYCPNWERRKTQTSGRTITMPGATIEYEEITGNLKIQAENVSVRCVKLKTSGRYGIECRSGCENLLVEDTEISGATEAQLVGLVSGAIYRRVHLYDSQGDHLKLDAGTLEESFLENDYRPTASSHNDAVQTGVSSGPIIIRNNNIEGPFQDQTSALIIKSDFGTINDVTIEGNRLYGGNYTLYLRSGGGNSAPDNVIVRDNVFVRDSWNFGPTSIDTFRGQCIVWEENRYSDDSSSVLAPAGGCSN